MNNEPVAWINVEKRKLEWDKPTLWETPTVVKLDRIPLYTHPVKELTISIVDVDNLAKQFWYNEGSGFHFHYYDFALAILRKAQEK